MKNGPRKTTYKITEYSCLPCKYLRTDLIRSGFEPLRDYHCTHPDKPRRWTSLSNIDDNKGTFIGRKPNTPEWCPYLKNGKKSVSISYSRYKD